jgi:membrane associated rhomboid family serine protease
MAYYQQRGDKRLSIGQDGNSLVLLIAINLTVYILLAFIGVIYYFTDGKIEGDRLFEKNILDWVTLPAHVPTFITRPWTILTHFFSHIDVWHIIGNMLWLWVFGFIFQDLSGNRKLGPVYIYGALAGAVAYMLAYNFIPALKPGLFDARALGASAGIMAVAAATTRLAPNYRIFPMLMGGIPLWVLTLIFLIMDLGLMTKGNTGGRIAHIAGAGMGFLFMVQLERGRDWSEWMNRFFDWVNNLFNPDVKKNRPVKKDLFYKANKPPYTTTRSNLNQNRVDAILDKINQKGYQSLTQEEKDILKRASKEDL